MSKINKIKVNGISYDIEDASKEQLINEYLWDGKKVDSNSEDYSMFQEILTKIINGEDVIVYTRVTIDDYRKNILIPMVCLGYISSTTYMHFQTYVPYIMRVQQGIHIYSASFTINYDNNGNVTSVTAISSSKHTLPKLYEGNVNINCGPLAVNNTYSYTPTSDYHPATKQYVDNAIAEAIANALASLQE